MVELKRDTIDTATTSWVEGYRRLTEVVIPRPIALVAESPVGLECRLEGIRTYGEEGGAGSLVVGRVVLMHLDPALRDPSDGRVLSERLRAVGRMGGSLWCRTLDTFTLERPS